jgi:two-component system, chemotaxis family, response regulator Rcp1
MAKRIHECVLLHVEDDDGTACLFRLALQEIGAWPQFFRVTDGEQAMAFLLQNGPYRSAPRPNLVLLDLNLPGKSGLDVLSEMKSNPGLRDIKVVVFSTSTLPYDRERSLQLGADDYLYKDGHFEAFVNVAELLLCEKLMGGG